jgi:hypothetical protein
MPNSIQFELNLQHPDVKPNSIQFELNLQHPDVFCHINSKFDLIFIIPL